MSKSKKKHKKLIIGLSVTFALLFSIVVAGVIYVNDYYRVDEEALSAFAQTGTIKKQVLKDNTVVYEPEEIKAGFIFYPGGKVEYTAYEPLMEACASKGILCVLAKMPFHLAVFDVDAAEGIPEQYPDIKKWYIGGHSLGGSMAASYLSKNTDKYQGLLLLGSYTTADLSETSLKALTIYGSEDNVLNREKYDNNKGHLPKGYREIIIEGGNHAYFGMYGEQDGDGTATITNTEQINQTANEIVKLVEE